MKLTPRRIVYALLGLAAVGVAVVASLPKPVPVDMAQAVRGAIRVTVDEDGKSRVKERYVVAAPFAGRLERIVLDPGDRVEAGKTVLAILEPAVPEFLDARALARAEAQVQAAQAARERAVQQVERAKVDHTYARTQLERQQKLYESRIASRQDLDAAEQRDRASAAELSAAQFGLQVAEFELDQARAALIVAGATGEGAQQRFEIRSPVSGAVFRVMQESETVVTAGTGLIEVGDPAAIEAVVDVLSSDAVKIAPGAPVLFEHWGGEPPLSGRVRLVEPSGFMKVSALGVEEQRVNVIVDFTDAPERRASLGDGFRLDARIVVAEAADVLKIPAGALFRRAGAWHVFAVESGRARLRPVEVGRRNDTEAEITGGLDAGATVIIYPSDRIRDGVAVAAR